MNRGGIKSGSLKITAYLLVMAGCAGYLYHYSKDYFSLDEKYDDYKKEQTTITKFDESTSVDQSVEESVEEIVKDNLGIDITFETEETTETEEESEPEIIIPQETYTSELLDDGYEFSEIDFEALKSKNEDVRGWITIDGTKIDFPVMQYSDNEYYLHNNIEGKSSQEGMIFQDCRTVSLEEPSYNLSDLTIIYGHHLKGQKMFAQLCKYKDKTFAKEHPFGIYYTTDGYAYKITFFAGRVINGADDSQLYRSSFESEEEFNEYFDDVLATTTFTTDIDINYQDKIVALVTCSYETSNSRYVLYGKLDKQYINYDQMINEENQMRR